MELLLLAMIFAAGGRSSSSGTEPLRRVQSTQSKLLDRSVANPVRKPSPYVNNFGTRSKPADAPASAPPAVDPETGTPQFDAGQAGLNCLQGLLSGAVTGGGLGLTVAGVGAGPGAIAGGLIGCGAGIVSEVVNPSGRS